MKYPRPLARMLARVVAGRSVTPTEGIVRLPGLPGRVEIYRDARGVPHIEAPDEAALFAAQGFCHAQDRLWQMEFNRRMTQGRMAEIFGDRFVDWQPLSIHFKGYTVARLDQFMRTIGLAAAAGEAAARLTEEERFALDAYVTGINLYLRLYGNRLPPEFALLRYQPERWTVVDSLCIAKGLEFQLCFGWRTKLARAGIAARLAAQPKKAAALDFSYPSAAPTILRYLGPDGTAATVEGLTELEGAVRRFAGWATTHAGSNNWVVSGDMTASGKPLLCNDPHLMLTAPAVWYQSHLKGGRYDVAGASVPGLPGIGVGHNRHIAWGITNVTADDADYYIEKCNPKDPNQVKDGRSWSNMTVRHETIRVKGAPDRPVQVRETRNGPLMSDLLADFARPVEAGFALSLKWVGHDPAVGLEGMLRLNRASNYAEFRDALSHWRMGTFNFVYADVEGNIAYQMAGRLPQRSNGPNRTPVPGWEKRYQWSPEYVPFTELPCTLNPPEGCIVTANNKTVDDSYPHYISDFFEPPHRATRIQELLHSRDKLTADDMRLFQFDTVSLFARGIVEDVLRPMADTLRGGSPAVEKALDLLLGWDGRFHTASSIAPLFACFYRAICQRLFSIALGENLWAGYFEILNENIPPTEAILRDPDNPWWDGQDRVRAFREALGEAFWQCTALLGSDIAEWQWGDVHGLILPHPLSENPWLERLFGIGPLPTGGDGLTVNNGTYLYRNPFRHFSGPAMRFVCNLADFDDTWIITCSGQSGNPLSPHYADQAPLWLQGIYQPLLYDERVYRAGRLLVLIPEGITVPAAASGMERTSP